ncbi:putative cyclin 1, putative,serine peptidase family S51, peptidase E [Trypanosoma grayi]|uniref:putative cyclin 1, putative,serine peptidase family S51, peptidase E n=1 Tax=Trypanosoma grayi TaxID=71804 RepID=UPI0004F403F6|nr:putative cyclin 1, putative,serine peptidase family S51, peptidase E [Trypanosoma grayi]KEG11728.1 putative cyclin 1, putative,serine peptidase family S51, peptidase E [Trypanosoma grayi]
MLKRHPTERGIGIDHWAALVLPGNGTYEVFAVPGKTCGSSTSAAPAVYVKDVVGGQVCATVLQQSGEIGELLRPPNGPVVRDPFEGYFAMLNPTAKTEKLLCRSK